MLGLTCALPAPHAPTRLCVNECFVSEQDAVKGLRSIPTGSLPLVFAELDNDTIVGSFRDTSMLQVWDLVAGKLVREIEGWILNGYSMVRLPEGRIAAGLQIGDEGEPRAGWDQYAHNVVTIFDLNLGKKEQELRNFRNPVIALAFVEGHLLTVCTGWRLRVWGQDDAGKVRRTVGSLCER